MSKAASKPKRLNPLETYEQERLVKWLKLLLDVPPKSFAAIPNGEERDPIVGEKLKRQGVTPGAFDLIFFTCPPIGLEMKRQSGGRVSPDQAELHAFAKANGWDVIVAEGAEVAKAELLKRPHFRDLIRNKAA